MALSIERTVSFRLAVLACVTAAALSGCGGGTAGAPGAPGGAGGGRWRRPRGPRRKRRGRPRRSGRPRGRRPCHQGPAHERSAHGRPRRHAPVARSGQGERRGGGRRPRGAGGDRPGGHRSAPRSCRLEPQGTAAGPRPRRERAAADAGPARDARAARARGTTRRPTIRSHRSRNAYATYLDAKATAERMHTLAGRGIVSPSDLQAAETRLKVAEAAYQSAIDTMRGQKALLQDRRASYDLAEKKLQRRHRARARSPGIVSDRLVQVGEYISERTVVATIVQVNPLKLRTGAAGEARGHHPGRAARRVPRGVVRRHAVHGQGGLRQPVARHRRCGPSRSRRWSTTPTGG